MKAGVRMSPRGVAITPLRAAPSVAVTSYENALVTPDRFAHGALLVKRERSSRSPNDVDPGRHAHRPRVQFMIDQTDRAVRLSDEKIEPVPSQDDFYGPDGRLRKPYRWYPRLLGYLSGNAVNVEASADSLQTAIRLRIEAEQ